MLAALLAGCAGAPSMGMRAVFEAILADTGYTAWPLPESARTRPGIIVTANEAQSIERLAPGPCFIENAHGEFTITSTVVNNVGVNLEALKSLGVGLSGEWARRVRYHMVEAVSYDLIRGDFRHLFAALPEAERRDLLARQAELATFDSVLGARALEIELVDEQGLALDLTSPAIASALDLTVSFSGERKNAQTLVYRGPPGGVYFGYRPVALSELRLASDAAPAAPPLAARFFLRAHAPGSVRSDLFVREGSALESGDRLQAVIEPREACHAYLFLHDSQGAMLPLFAAPLAAGAAQVLPGPSDYWVLDDHPGRETFFLVLARGAAGDLEALARELRAAGAAGAADTSGRAVTALRAYGLRGFAEETLLGAPVGVPPTPREITLSGRGDLVFHQIAFFHRPPGPR